MVCKAAIIRKQDGTVRRLIQYKIFTIVLQMAGSHCKNSIPSLDNYNCYVRRF